MPKLLKLVKKSHPILRQIMPDEKNFQDPVLLKVIENMAYSILPKQLVAANTGANSAAGMAANQWGLKRRVFIFTPDGSDGKADIMINPSYVPYVRPIEVEPKLVASFEGCFSVPLAYGLVNRFEAIKATYFTVDGTKVERIMEGWEARVFQHETDHLNGKLYDGRLDNLPGPECFERVDFKDKKEQEEWVSKLKENNEK